MVNMSHERRSEVSPSAAELISTATKRPGVADLLALYQRHQEVVAAASIYVVQARPKPTVTAGADTITHPTR